MDLPHAHTSNARRAFSTFAAVALVALVFVLAGVTWALVSALRADQADAESTAHARAGSAAKAAGPAANAGAGVRAVEAGLDAAATYHRDGLFAEAAAILAKLADDVPFDPRIRLALAQALIGRGDHAAAYEQYQAAIAIEQQSASASSGGIAQSMSNNPPLAQLQAEAGTCALKAGLVDRAIEHYTAAQLADATNPRYPLFLAMAQIRAGDDSAAMASLVRVTLLEPDSAEAWGTMAELELRKNRVDLASQHLDRAIALQPDLVKWRLVQGRIFNRKREPERALAVLGALPDEARVTKPVLQLMGESFGLLARPADAAAMYDRAAKAQPTDPELWYQSALWHQRAGNAQASRKSASTAAMLGHPEARSLAGVDPATP